MPLARLLFVGPTLHRGRELGLPLPVDDFELRSPIRRGDIDQLRGREPGLLVIVDGYFHLRHLAVGHAELRDAIAAGWEVWGLSSMGAIRAAEMHSLGMRGFGRVFQAYVDDPTFRDDEVTLLHEGEPPYRTFSEPLVHIRAYLAAQVASDALAPSLAEDILLTLRRQWFGDRTLAALRSLLPGPLAESMERLDAYQLKSQDLSEFLSQRPWSR